MALNSNRRSSSFIVLVVVLCLACANLEVPKVKGTGRFEINLTIDNYPRKGILHIPDTYSKSKVIPLVVFLHGFAGSAEQAEKDYLMVDKAKKEGFALLFVEGVPSTGPLGLKSWNAGSCCEFAAENNIDDVKYIKEIIESVKQKSPGVGEKAVFLTGISNGAMMVYRLAIELPAYFNAIAPVSGPIMIDIPPLISLTPILHIHSLIDDKVPFEGGVGLGGVNFKSAEDGIINLMKINSCGINVFIEIERDLFIEKKATCSSGIGIKLLLTKDGGHSWPGGIKARASADKPSQAFNATDEIWEFFKLYE